MNQSSILLLNLLVKNFCDIELMDDNSFFAFADNSLEDWKKHLGQLRVKFPSLRLVQSHLINFHILQTFDVI